MSEMSHPHRIHFSVHFSRTRDASPPSQQLWLWYATAAVGFFLVPAVGTGWLGLQPDLYYLGYFTVAVVFFTAFVTRYADALKELWTLHLWQTVVLGAVVGAALAAGIFAQTGTARAAGWHFGFEIVWRGLVYGTVDALTLFVFPAAVAYLLLHGDRHSTARRAAFAGLALVLSMFVTATYHLGYSEFRSQDLRYPELGAVAANVPIALTGNPVGAVVTHVTMHTSAVVHQRDGGQQHMLPPRATGDYPNHGSSDLAAGLAALWLVATAAALTALVRSKRP
ncbi:hypothetical protein [Nocardioides panaciterrulae]|uniref:Uncharacterized protein n=1 Tax=Nocardioides panaciterrulae TaxID=661492 RepID=A0A7Y9E5L7_9ACTN|nr:hypothetical protein [Nocardioides panaciterrulae]NYD41653.1 hypothetical protein [Nocardioides panaciterrulae]